VGNVTFNPMTTTNATSTFILTSDGYIQGTALPDPALRYNLEGAQVGSTQSTPLWGGLPITLAVPPTANGLIPYAIGAVSIATIDGWCVYDQASAMIITPNSNAPQATSGMSINFYRAGSLARLVLPVNSTLVSSLIAGRPNQQVQWDFTNNWIEAYTSGTALPILIEQLSVTSKTVTYNSGSGTTNWSYSGSVAVCRV
jgi:hypothetical protein